MAHLPYLADDAKLIMKKEKRTFGLIFFLSLVKQPFLPEYLPETGIFVALFLSYCIMALDGAGHLSGAIDTLRPTPFFLSIINNPRIDVPFCLNYFY